MGRRYSFLLFLAGLVIGIISPIYALEKVKLSSSVKTDPGFYLPISAAEEKGFWKDNGLEVEWVPFTGGTPMMQAVAARAINIGLAGNDIPALAAERGLPVFMVAELSRRPFFLWVRTDSPYRQPQELKGAKVGVSALGSGEHTWARIILAAHGIEKDVRFIGSGGVAQTLAGIRVGAFDAFVLSMGSAITLKVEGIVREIAMSHDYLPKPWFDHSVFVRKDFARSKPEVVRQTLKAILQATDFMRKSPDWAIAKVKGVQGISDEAAKLVRENVEFTTSGKIDRKAMENVRKVLIEYGILTEKVPAVDELFTNEYLP